MPNKKCTVTFAVTHFFIAMHQSHCYTCLHICITTKTKEDP